MKNGIIISLRKGNDKKGHKDIWKMLGVFCFFIWALATGSVNLLRENLINKIFMIFNCICRYVIL